MEAAWQICKLLSMGDVPEYESIIKQVTTGSSLAITGTIKESPGKNQRVELHATSWELLGVADAENYPLQKKRHSFEFLREIAHLRPRTNTFGAVTRVRNACSAAVHDFFSVTWFFIYSNPHHHNERL